MPKKALIILSLSSVVLALVILFISLVMVSPAYRIENDPGRGGRRFYLARRILPDHYLYPVFNLADQSQIRKAEVENRALLRLETGMKRLEGALELAQKDVTRAALIVMAAQKSHIYVVEGVDELLQKTQFQPGEVVYFSEMLTEREEMLREISAKLLDQDRAKIDQILAEEGLLKQRIWLQFPEEFALRVEEGSGGAESGGEGERGGTRVENGAREEGRAGGAP